MVLGRRANAVRSGGGRNGPSGGQFQRAQVGDGHHGPEEEDDRPPARQAQAQGAQEAGTQVPSQARQGRQEAEVVQASSAARARSPRRFTTSRPPISGASNEISSSSRSITVC